MQTDQSPSENSRDELLKGCLPGTDKVFDFVTEIGKIPDVQWRHHEQAGVRGAIGPTAMRPQVENDQIDRPAATTAGEEDDVSWKNDGNLSCLCPVAVHEWNATKNAQNATAVHEAPWDTVAELHVERTEGWNNWTPEQVLNDITVVPWLLLVVASDARTAKDWCARSRSWGRQSKGLAITRRIQAERTAVSLRDWMKRQL